MLKLHAICRDTDEKNECHATDIDLSLRNFCFLNTQKQSTQHFLLTTKMFRFCRNLVCNQHLKLSVAQQIKSTFSPLMLKLPSINSIQQIYEWRRKQFVNEGVVYSSAKCHMGSHAVTCHPAEVTFPRLPQRIRAGT